MSCKLNFDAAASGTTPATERVERKVCEGLCGGCFWRPVPATARGGEKLCADCKVRMVPGVIPAKWDLRRADLFDSYRKFSKAS